MANAEIKLDKLDEIETPQTKPHDLPAEAIQIDDFADRLNLANVLTGFAIRNQLLQIEELAAEVTHKLVG